MQRGQIPQLPIKDLPSCYKIWRSENYVYYFAPLYPHNGIYTTRLTRCLVCYLCMSAFNLRREGRHKSKRGRCGSERRRAAREEKVLPYPTLRQNDDQGGSMLIAREQGFVRVKPLRGLIPCKG